MSLLINLRHLENKDVKLSGKMPVSELNLDFKDELVHANKPLSYDLTAQKVGEQVLVQGRLEITLECECVRCLKRFDYPLVFKDWVCYLPLEGEEKIVVSNDCVDLTPYIREDILLEFPQHPLCETDCAGLPKDRTDVTAKKIESASQTQNSSAWSELNKLKF
jgi:uncharacterized metal-binding protein YceD (DUF177 family)